MSFYLQSWKLIFAVYHIVTDPKTNTSKFNRYQAEAVIPWVNDVVLYLTIALQTAQQLKDKVCIIYFQYIDWYTYINAHFSFGYAYLSTFTSFRSMYFRNTRTLHQTMDWIRSACDPAIVTTQNCERHIAIYPLLQS